MRRHRARGRADDRRRPRRCAPSSTGSAHASRRRRRRLLRGRRADARAIMEIAGHAASLAHGRERQGADGPRPPSHMRNPMQAALGRQRAQRHHRPPDRARPRRRAGGACACICAGCSAPSRSWPTRTRNISPKKAKVDPPPRVADRGASAARRAGAAVRTGANHEDHRHQDIPDAGGRALGPRLGLRRQGPPDRARATGCSSRSIPMRASTASANARAGRA